MILYLECMEHRCQTTFSFSLYTISLLVNTSHIFCEVIFRKLEMISLQGGREMCCYN